MPQNEKLYITYRRKMLGLLDTFSSEQEQQQYKQAVPFVHIPFELFDQWGEIYKTEYKWFYKVYTPEAIVQLQKINKLINSIIHQYKEELEDVPEILDNPLWQQLMSETQKVKEAIEKQYTTTYNQSI
ncbi:hypothetical protein QNI19_24240 [Cytophagaceae bacterium DM2B3-1]|uniref:Uncharacterized protein n=1 Tax=Xanthocytophaga flava TaxID=3048013 RepID=A0ABT7CQN7_9BACT|nr:hypothetical protein [Xanthocytophaga flavus]MDJ1496068.1 hypothetical protein [Xanthocytophaga flavus]